MNKLRRRIALMLAGILALALLVPGWAGAADPAFSAFVGKNIAVQTGMISDEIARNAIGDIQISYYNSQTDAMTALRAGKVDAWSADEPVARYLLMENTDLVKLDKLLDQASLAAVFPKTDEGQRLCDEYSDFVDSLWEDGTMDEIDATWFSLDESRKTVPDYENLPATNGTLRMAADTSVLPFVFVKDNNIVGYDVDIAARFCQAKGYRLEIEPMSFDGLLPSVQTGKCDFAASCITVTEERAESVLFSTETYKSGAAIVVRRGEEPAGLAAQGTQGTGSTGAKPEYTSFDDLKGKKVSMLTGAPFEELVLSKQPDVAGFSCYNSMPDLAQALRSKKTDAVLSNNAVALLTVNRNPDLVLFPENLKDGTFGFAFAKGNLRRDEWQAEFDAIPKEEIWAAWDKWTGADESVKTLPEQDWPGLNGTMRVAACDTLEPMSYAGEGGAVKGFDIEILLMIAKRLDMKLEVTGMEFSAILSSVSAGKADIGAGSIIITDERAESVDFVEYYPAAFALVVRAVKEVRGEITSFADLEHARIGVTTGSIQAQQVPERFPDAEVFYFSSDADMLAALRTGKIDAFSTAEALVRYIEAQNPDLTHLDEALGEGMTGGAVFPKTEKGQALCDEFNAFLKEIHENGVYEEIQGIWFGEDEDRRAVPDLYTLPATRGTLRMAVDTSMVPFVYIKDGKPVGVEIDTAVRFCKEYGYALEVVPMDFSGIIPSVVTGKTDFSNSGIAYTPERAESVLYSDVTLESHSVLAILKKRTAEAGNTQSFWEDISSSFEKTFIRENRWQLFLDGVLTSFAITALAILFGTALGFAIFMLCRNGNPVANSVTRFMLWLIRGTPMVVLLMILYYIIFGSAAVSGLAVAVIGFSMTFGSSVYGLLKMGVGAVDRGQYEAAYALGHTNRHTFFRIILPQAIPHVLPSYRGEIVALIKATAVVGYIAVQDLTKMGDIVRSRTYEAFFPLIAVTVIYFLLESLLGFLVGRITVSTDPKKRKPEKILKGVKFHD